MVTADGAVVDRDRRLFGAADRQVLAIEEELLSGLRADDDDEPIGSVVYGPALDGGVARLDDELRLVDELDSIVAGLEHVAMRHGQLGRDALSVDVGPVVALEIADEPAVRGALQERVLARNVAIRKPDRVRLVTAEPVLVVGELKRRLLLLVVLDGELPHGPVDPWKRVRVL